MAESSFYTNDLEVRMTGMSRSGNHAIINWILQQAGPGYCYLNCTEPKQSPFQTARPLAENGECYRTDIEGFSLEDERSGRFGGKNLLLFNHEDVFLGPLGNPRCECHRDDWVGTSRRRVDLLILRDPFNLFASRFQLGLSWEFPDHPPFSALARRIWQQHARQFLGERQHFPGEWQAVSYDRWTLDPGYRKEIAQWLGIPFTDAGFEEVASCAGGSSFDGLSPTPSALRRQVHDRWRLLSAEPSYRAFFDSATRELACRCFPATGWIGEKLADV